MPASLPPFAIVGAGRLGEALAILLQQAGYPLVALRGRDEKRLEQVRERIDAPVAAINERAALRQAALVFFTLPDDRIAPVAQELREENLLHPFATLIHCSGLHPSAILGEGRYPRLSLHPMQTIPDAAAGVRALPGSCWTVEGDESALILGDQLVEACGGIPRRIAAADKPRYHAAAAMTANLCVALFAQATQVMTGCGFTPEDARAMLHPLLMATAANLGTKEAKEALTGPASRGDVATVERHLTALGSLSPEIAATYRQLSRQAVRLAAADGRLTQEKQKELFTLLAG